MAIRQSSKKTNSKRKGSSFEREQARILSLWVSKNKDKDLLWRSHSSGGRASIGKIHGAQHGDIALAKYSGTGSRSAKDLLKTFCIECKSYKKFDLLSAFCNKNHELWKWWEQVSEEASKSKTLPFLIVKRSGMDPVVFLPRELGAFFENKNFIIFPKAVMVLQKDLLSTSWQVFFRETCKVFKKGK